ncbi:MAG TPA: glycoside hydrolase family 3 N-terminal domain-containing protein [Pyrinomonadaceae bacterium]|jgi:beta-glucosidase
MKKTALFLLVAICFQTFCLQLQQSFAQGKQDLVATEITDSDAYFKQTVQHPKLKDYSAQVESLLKKMTLEEKVGQMTQLEIGQITSGENSTIQIDSAKLEKAIVKYQVGSILNVNNYALSVDKWWEIIGAIQAASARTRLKIPNIYGIDSIHGANYVHGATLFPQEIAMAASWNPALMHRAAEITAAETRAAAIPWSFSPVLDIGRQPLWARFWETFGEDPYLAKVMGASFIRGLEGTDVASETRVASSLKHYMGYSFPLNGRDRTSSWIPENYLREYFLPTFDAAVKSGARTVMVNSAEINGVPGHINKYLLTDVLKTELGFDGFIVSDWQDIQKLVTQWKVAADEKEATRMAIMAGIDMSMVPQSYSFSDNLIALVKEKKVPMTRIDDAVRRILRVKYQLGLFDKPMPDAAVKNNFAKPEYSQVSLQAARETLVLLKNDNNILPLAKNKKVLVTGPTADSLISLNNGWTWTWQGSEQSLYPTNKMTVQQAIEAKIGKKNFEFRQGTRIARLPNGPGTMNVDEEVNIKDAVDEAKDSDVVVLCLGEGSYTETPGNITDLTLPETQLRFAEAIIATGKPVVLVMVEGRPRLINRIADKVSGILLAMNPSNEGGQAIADVLFGDYNPNGKLPFTYPRSTNNYMTYDHKLFEVEETSYGNSANSPQFLFGSGLSYTTYAYSDLTLSSKSVPANGSVNVSFKVTNTGTRAGKETAILYLRDDVATLSPAGKRVRRFAKIYLDPGQSRTLQFTLGSDDFSFIGTNNKPLVEPGDFTVMVGNLSEKFSLK